MTLAFHVLYASFHAPVAQLIKTPTSSSPVTMQMRGQFTFDGNSGTRMLGGMPGSMMPGMPGMMPGMAGMGEGYGGPGMMREGYRGPEMMRERRGMMNQMPRELHVQDFDPRMMRQSADATQFTSNVNVGRDSPFTFDGVSSTNRYFGMPQQQGDMRMPPQGDMQPPMMMHQGGHMNMMMHEMMMQQQQQQRSPMHGGRDMMRMPGMMPRDIQAY